MSDGNISGSMDGREMVTIRARDKTTQKDLILKVPKDASIEEVRAPLRSSRVRDRPGHDCVYPQIQPTGGQAAVQGRIQAGPRAYRAPTAAQISPP